MKYRLFSLLFLFQLLSLNAIGQERTDTLVGHALKDVVVEGQHMIRTETGMLVLPNSYQRKHSSNAIELLYNSFIPGVNVDVISGNVTALGESSTLYINGQPCEMAELMMVRPKDILKIEYYDIPNGKYSKGRTSINFIVKRYNYGGYAMMKLQQYVGYNHGVYDIASSMNFKNNTFSVLAGADYKKVSGNETSLDENFLFNPAINRLKIQEESYKTNSQYCQLKYQRFDTHNYLVTKLTLINKDVPYTTIYGRSELNDVLTSTFSSDVKQRNLSPKLDINGEYKYKNKSLNYGLHFTYSHNDYSRQYSESDYQNKVNEKENAYSFSAACIYNDIIGKGNFTAELFHYHNIWDSHYHSDSNLWQHLWKGETLVFASYNKNISKKLILTSRVGIDWVQYSLHNSKYFSQLTPRVNMRLQMMIPKGSLLYSVNYVNSTYGMEVVNNANIAVDQYISIKGNPNLKKSHDINSYVYYTQQFGKKLSLSAVLQYNYAHNFMTVDYSIDESKMQKSFRNDCNTNLLSEVVGLSYMLSTNMSIGGNINHSYSWMNSNTHVHTNNFTGNINMAYYWRNFSVQPVITFAKRILDFTNMTESEIPVDYSANFSYSNKNLFLSCMVSAPFSKRHVKTKMESIPYSQYANVYDKTKSQYCNISIVYSFDFGHKVKVDNSEINKSINSSLLKVN